MTFFWPLVVTAAGTSVATLAIWQLLRQRQELAAQLQAWQLVVGQLLEQAADQTPGSPAQPAAPPLQASAQRLPPATAAPLLAFSQPAGVWVVIRSHLVRQNPQLFNYWMPLPALSTPVPTPSETPCSS